jgi:uncharacterized protein (DUF1800 family)
MSWTRRDILAAATAAGAAATLGGCEKIISKASEHFGQTVPDSVTAPASAEVDPAHHLLNRAGYGPWPGDVEQVRAIGEHEWIEQQLNPESIGDALCELRTGQFNEIKESPGDCYGYNKSLLRRQMARQTLIRAVYSKRQLFEVMAGFWTDHLNINISKGDCVYLKPEDDRQVIRKHALGKFRDLIRASATSAAMLVYLDGAQNSPPKPNENYGRELIELHTLGVGGGYTQHDVYEAARALTGWRVGKNFLRRGAASFDPAHHDDGEKHLLGNVIPAKQGEQDVDRVVDIVCSHPSTARHIATKLVKRFVAEQPPAPLVDRVAEVFRTTDGDIKSMLRTILTSDEFKKSAGSKFKPPFRYIVSALRAVGADTHAHPPLIDYLERMGQGVFEYPTPDGYPDKATPWLGTLLWRWNFAFALADGKVPTVQAPVQKLLHALEANGEGSETTLFRYFVGRLPQDQEQEAFRAARLASPVEQVGLMLASPQFQWC